MAYLLWILAGIIFTETVGYWLHILLHSEKMPSLARAHMLHHLRDYGPGKALHRKEYVSSADDRHALLGFGFEWMAPILLIVGVSLGLLGLIGVPLRYQLVFTVSGMFWGYVLFGYMHSAMHLTDFWMQKVPLLRNWYLNLRQLHDFHHLQISDDGRMLKNYGICFYGFDRLFRTLSPEAKRFNQAGHQAALVRYREILK